MEKRPRVAIVVLGDIGRSPRMQYHALSLATQAHFEVDIVANVGNKPHLDVIENQSIHIHKMASVNLEGLSRISRALSLLIKAATQFFILVWFLCFKISRPDAFLVQNPPSVPTLIAVKLCSWLRQSGFVIDWHNYGYTLLYVSHDRSHIKMSPNRSHVLVKLYKWFEEYFGKMADASLCVTKEMKHDLALNWDVIASVFYDKPHDLFHPSSLKERHELFGSIDLSKSELDGCPDFVSIGLKRLNGDSTETLFSTWNGDNVYLKPSRPALVVSSTSWTSDEDFGLLLEAAVKYDELVAAALNENTSIDEEKHRIDYLSNGSECLYPRLVFIVTGKGPDRKKYEEQFKALKLKHVAFRTMWLDYKDYPLLLGSADLGVCLHKSSSGRDLPMKVVDMFGCGLPVCAYSYNCIEELIKVGENGLLFSNSSELAEQLMMLFRGFPNKCDALKALRDGALDTRSSSRWSTEWEMHALPAIQSVVRSFRRNAE